ncbi:hypothetical protein ACLKA6_003341 [Drosophila palustris]
MGHLLCRIRHQENSHDFKEAVNCFQLGAILLRTACFHWAAPAGSSVLRESPIPGPQFIAIDNSPIHKTAVDIRNFTTLQENSTAINKTNNKRIPVPDPGVPALPETDTFLRLPLFGPLTDLLVKCWPYFPSPFQTQKLAGHHFNFSNNNSNQATAQRSVTSCNTLCVYGSRAGFARRVYPRPSAGSGEDHTRSVRSKGKQLNLFCEQRAWEHQSPVRGPSYRHTDSLPTDPTWRPDLRGVEGTLERRDIVIRFFLSGLHPLAPTGRSELASKIGRRKARGERRNGSRESLLVLLDQSWVRCQVIRADFRAGTSAYPLTLSPLSAGPEKLAALVRRTAEDFGYCFQIARAREGEARLRRWYSRRMESEMRCQMRYYGAPALDISMEPSGRSGVAPPPGL